MATKTFNDICVEYAHQLGKGLPLTAPEMCNALVMYLNQQVVDMQSMVQTALNAVKDVQDDLAEGEYATLGANNAFRGNNSFSQTIQANGGITINGENVATENDIPDMTDVPSLSSNNTYTNRNTFIYSGSGCPIISSNGLTGENRVQLGVCPSSFVFVDGSNQYTINTPRKTGLIALTSDIPDLNNYTGVFQILHGSSGSGVAVHDTTINSPYSKYSYNKIYLYGNSNLLLYTLNLPNKNGTIATLDDIKSSSVTKYFTRIIFHNTDEDTQYILFSCITDTDLSANTSYQNVVDLLYSLGATTTDTALPCTGKTISGGIVVGVYTDGVNIIVFDTDNSTEDLTMKSEIKFISK